MQTNQPWIHSLRVDLSFIILPGILSVILVYVLNHFDALPTSVSPWSWLIVVVLFDVAHVWSTLFRTYLHKYACEEFSKELFLIPLFCWFGATMIHVVGARYFWSLMAYIAVFHFIKQQLGLLKIYSRKEKAGFIKKYETFFLYLITLYPVLFWHLNPRTFQWFRENDFISFQSEILSSLSFILYISGILLYLFMSIYQVYKSKSFNAPKYLLLVNTMLVWYVGIVFIDNDWSFTVTNVINHGIPYMALIYISSLQGPYSGKSPLISKVFSRAFKFKVTAFLFVIFSLGYLEEFFWDTFVWGEHSNIFFGIQAIQLDSLTMSVMVAALSVPQLTHYVLDGFIWKSARKVEEFKF